MDVDDVTMLEDPGATRLKLAVHLHLTALHHKLGVPPSTHGTRKLQKRAQRKRAIDHDVDQVLRRIGMMRYTKSPPAALMSPGRSGLVNRITTAASSTASIPSTR